MKRQQVLSRFFAAKPGSSSSGPTQNARIPAEDAIEPPSHRERTAATVTLPRHAPLSFGEHHRLSKKRPKNAEGEDNLESRPLKRQAPSIRKGRNYRLERLSVAAESDPGVLQTDDQFFESDTVSPTDDQLFVSDAILQTDVRPEETDTVELSDSSSVSVGDPESADLYPAGDDRSEGKLAAIEGIQKPRPIAKRRSIENLIEGIPPSDPVKHEYFVKKLLSRAEVNGEVKEAWYGNPPTGKEKFTPLELQVVELKAKFPDVILMVEVGYRYRFFGKDAETAARTLGIVAHYDHNFLTASIPAYRLHVHVRRLVAAGLKVGVVRQKETAAIKAHGSNKTGPFSRGLSALYTRATLEAAEDLGGGTEDSISRLSSYLMCIAESSIPAGNQTMNATGNRPKDSGRVGDGNHDTEFGVVAVETATGDIMFGNFKDTIVRSELESRLLTCSPAELLLATPLSSTTEKLLLDFTGRASDVRVERVSRDCFKDGGALGQVLDFYTSKGSHEETDFEECKGGGNDGIEAVLGMPDLVLQALALALRYLKQFNLERLLKLSAVFRPFSGLNEMNLSPNTLRQLEILKNNFDGTEKGSLLWLMDHTKTAFGARLLRYWVTHPLCDHNLIAARLDAVDEIARSMGSSGVPQIQGTFPGSGKGGGTAGAVSHGQIITGGASLKQDLLGGLLGKLGKMPDLERGITRIFHRTATAAEFVAVIQALTTAANHIQHLQFQEEVNGMMDLGSEQKCVQRLNSPLLQRLISAVSSAPICEHAPRFLSALNTDAAVAGDKQNLFNCKDGKFPEIVKCRAAIRAAEKELDSYLPQFRKLLRLPNLQYMSLNGLSYIVEAPVAQRVPQNWLKLNNTKKYQRYHPPEVLETTEKLALAQEQLVAASLMAWDTFLAEFSSYYVDFRASVQALAALDCLHSLALVSRNQGYTRPEFVEECKPSQLMIESGRHPILDSTLQDAFVPNDTFMAGFKECCQIITGPNMGGKSCYIRQVALISIMAQVGSYVPASSAKLHAFDSVQTRMGASDCLQKGSSTFFEELSETSTILRTATSRSLVILDELGRGTSTHDGVAIAYATLQYLLKQTHCLTLFVTHYPKIVELKDEFPGEVGPYYVSYMAHKSTTSRELAVNRSDLEDDSSTSGKDLSDAAQTITFLYKLVPGVASKSFGLHVARLAQIPEACVLHASTMATKFEKAVSNWRNDSFGTPPACNMKALISLDREDSTNGPTDLGEQDTLDIEDREVVSDSPRTVRSVEREMEPWSRVEASSTIDFRDCASAVEAALSSCKENGIYTDESGIQKLLLLIRNSLAHAVDSESSLSLLKDIQQLVQAYLSFSKKEGK